MDHLCSYPLRVSIWWYGHNNFFMMAVSNTDTFFQVISKREKFVKTFRSTFATSSLCCHCAGSRTAFAVLGNFLGCGLPHGPSAYSKVLFLCWLTCFHSIQSIDFKYPRLVGPALFVSFFVFTLLEGEFILPSQFGESLKVFTILPYTAAASIHKIRLKASVLNIHTFVVTHMTHLEASRKLWFAHVTHLENLVYHYKRFYCTAIYINLHLGVTIVVGTTCPLKTSLAGTWHGIVSNFWLVKSKIHHLHHLTSCCLWLQQTMRKLVHEQVSTSTGTTDEKISQHFYVHIISISSDMELPSPCYYVIWVMTTTSTEQSTSALASRYMDIQGSVCRGRDSGH